MRTIGCSSTEARSRQKPRTLTLTLTGKKHWAAPGALMPTLSDPFQVEECAGVSQVLPLHLLDGGGGHLWLRERDGGRGGAERRARLRRTHKRLHRRCPRLVLLLPGAPRRWRCSNLSHSSLIPIGRPLLQRRVQSRNGGPRSHGARNRLW